MHTTERDMSFHHRTSAKSSGKKWRKKLVKSRSAQGKNAQQGQQVENAEVINPPRPRERSNTRSSSPPTPAVVIQQRSVSPWRTTRQQAQPKAARMDPLKFQFFNFKTCRTHFLTHLRSRRSHRSSRSSRRYLLTLFPSHDGDLPQEFVHTAGLQEGCPGVLALLESFGRRARSYP